MEFTFHSSLFSWGGDMLAEINQRTDIHPSLEELLPLSAQGNLVPIYRELPADLDTPVSVYLKLAGHGASFLLESVEGGEQIGRYSFIGVEPSALLTFNGRSVTRRVNGSTSTFDLPKGNDPLHVLQAELARFKPVALPGLPRFVGGLVGYLGYDVIRFFEPKLDHALKAAPRDNPPSQPLDFHPAGAWPCSTFVCIGAGLCKCNQKPDLEVAAGL